MRITFYPARGDATEFDIPAPTTIHAIIEALASLPGVPPTGVKVFVDGKQLRHEKDAKPSVFQGWWQVVLVQDCTSDWLYHKSWRVQAKESA